MRQAEPSLFPASVNDNCRLIVGHDIPPAGKVDLERINRDARFPRRELHQAELRSVGVFRDELGVKRDGSRFAHVRAEIIKFVLRCNQPVRHELMPQIVSLCFLSLFSIAADPSGNMNE